MASTALPGSSCCRSELAVHPGLVSRKAARLPVRRSHILLLSERRCRWQRRGRCRRVLCRRSLLRALPPATCPVGSRISSDCPAARARDYRHPRLPPGLFPAGILNFGPDFLAYLTAVEQDNMLIREVVVPALGDGEAGVACPDNGDISVDLRAQGRRWHAPRRQGVPSATKLIIGNAGFTHASSATTASCLSPCRASHDAASVPHREWLPESSPGPSSSQVLLRAGASSAVSFSP